MTEDKIQVDSDMTPLLCHVPIVRGQTLMNGWVPNTSKSDSLGLCAKYACHGTEYVSVFSGKIASGVKVVVRTDNQSVLKIHIWLSVTIFGCLGQPDNHYYEP